MCFVDFANQVKNWGPNSSLSFSPFLRKSFFLFHISSIFRCSTLHFIYTTHKKKWSSFPNSIFNNVTTYSWEFSFIYVCAHRDWLGNELCNGKWLKQSVAIMKINCLCLAQSNFSIPQAAPPPRNAERAWWFLFSKSRQISP